MPLPTSENLRRTWCIYRTGFLPMATGPEDQYNVKVVRRLIFTVQDIGQGATETLSVRVYADGASMPCWAGKLRLKGNGQGGRIFGLVTPNAAGRALQIEFEGGFRHQVVIECIDVIWDTLTESAGLEL